MPILIINFKLKPFLGSNLTKNVKKLRKNNHFVALLHSRISFFLRFIPKAWPVASPKSLNYLPKFHKMQPPPGAFGRKYTHVYRLISNSVYNKCDVCCVF